MLREGYEERMAVPQGKKKMKQAQKCNEAVRLPEPRQTPGDMGDCRPLWEPGQNARDVGFKRR